MASSQDPETLRQTIIVALGLTPEQCGSREAMEAYRYALRVTWIRMEAVLGSGGAKAILQYAVNVASRRYPEAALVGVGDDGPDLSRVSGEVSNEDLRDLCKALQELFFTTFRTLAELTGEVIARPLLEELRPPEGERGSG